MLVCQSGNRAVDAQIKLEGAGKTGLRVLDGGMNAWRAAGGEINEGARGKWAMDRQVRLAAGSLVLAGILGSVFAPKAKWLAGGVGGGLFFSAVSNTCAMANVLGRLPYNQGAEGYDIIQVIEQLSQAAD